MDQQQVPVSNFAGVGTMSDDGCVAQDLSHGQMPNSDHDSASCEGLHHAQPLGCRASEFEKPCIRDSGSESPVTSLAVDCDNSGDSSTCKSVHGQIRTYDSLDEFCWSPQSDVLADFRAAAQPIHGQITSLDVEGYDNSGDASSCESVHGQIRTFDSLDEFCWSPQSVPGQARATDVLADFRPAALPAQGQVKACDSLDDLDALCLDPQAASCCNTLRVLSHFPDEPANVASTERLNSALHVCLDALDESNSMTSQSQDLDDDVAWNQSKQQASNGVSYPACGMYTDGKTAAVRTKTITTLMVQNIPRRCCRTTLAAEIDRSGFAASFDFVYVPTMFKSDIRTGFGFINFISQDVAMAFKHKWNMSWRFRSIGQCTKVRVVEARIQGLQANMKQWGRRALVNVKNPNFRPLMPNV